MKVLLIGPFPPPHGGVATTVVDLRDALARTAEAVQVLDIGDSRSLRREKCIPVYGMLDFLAKLLMFVSCGYIIHLETNGHNVKSWLSAFVCSVAGLFNRRRTVIAFGSGDLPSYLGRLSGWRALMVKTAVVAAGAIICRNAEMEGAIRRVWRGARIYIVPGFMGIDLENLPPLPPHIQHFYATHAPVIGIAATLAPEYGLEDALWALKEVQRTLSEVGLICIGVGKEAEELVRRYGIAQDHILLLGSLDRPVALSVMERLNVFVRPTAFDGDSVSVREALALGVPVIATNTGNRPKKVILFEKGDKASFAAKILAVLQSPKHEENLQASSGARENLEQMMMVYRQVEVA